MRVFNILIFVLALTSCSVFKRNKDVLNKDQFAQVLADIHLADAVLAEKGYSPVKDSVKINMYYADIFKKNNITLAQFDSTLKYYTVHAEKYDLVYDQVLEILSKRQEEIKLEANNKNKKKEIE